MLRQSWATIIVTSLILIMAAVALASRPRVSAARAFAVLGIAAFASMPWAVGMHVGDLVDGYGFWLYYIPSAIGYPLTMVALLHFWLVFPEAPRSVLDRPWLLPVLYLVPLGVVGLALVIMLFTDPTGPALLLGPSAITAHVAAPVYTVAGLGAAVWRFRTAVDRFCQNSGRRFQTVVDSPLAADAFTSAV